MCADFKEHEPNTVSFTGLNTGNFTWNIVNKDLIQNILNASNKKKFESKPFTIAKLQWILQLYPNGNKEDNKGNVKVFLKLLAMPSGLDSIVFSRIITCNQTLTNNSFFRTFKKDGDRTSWPDRTLLLTEWVQINPDHLSISLSINIIQLILNEQNDYDRISRLGSYLYVQQLGPDNKTYTNNSKYIYTINQTSLYAMKQWTWGKSMYSNIFDNLWQICLNPGGKDEARMGFVGIYLKLCNLPSYVKSIKVKYKITCDQTNDIEAYEYEFGIDTQSYGYAKLMPSSILRSLNSLSFTININILEVKFERDEDKLFHTIYDQYEALIDDCSPHLCFCLA